MVNKNEHTEHEGNNEELHDGNSSENASEKLEKKELENKYYAQKKEIRKKLSEAEKALKDEVEDTRADYKKVLEEEPDLMNKEEKDGFEKYVNENEEKIKLTIETLQAHENELELDYEDLKTEPNIDVTIEYSKQINHSVLVNGPLTKMVFDYFNFLNDKKENQKKAKIAIDCFLDDKSLFMESFPHNTNMEYYYGSVIIDFKKEKNVRIIVTMKKYYEQSQGFIHKMCFFSEGKTYLNPDYLSKKILFNAIAHSRIKGSYITMGAGSITWKQEKLEERAFSDIYLPKGTMDDLKLYTTLHDKTGKLLRYLMIGSPGTGKTESTLAIANYLKNNKVTIIKTMVCEALKEKVELAELLAPSLIIFDDIDLSLGSRKKGMVSGGLAQFLDVLDGTEKIRKDVGIIATTNSLELLDMAAQRPGRFDKLLSFDSLTKGNIRSIILKSLKYNFELESDSPEVIPFVSQDVVDLLHSSRVTGSHVYNQIKMLYLRIQTLEIEGTSSEYVTTEIKNELETLKRIRNTNYLDDKLAGKGGSDIGFMKNDIAEEEEEEEDMYVHEVDEKAHQEMTFSTKEENAHSYKGREGSNPSEEKGITQSNEGESTHSSI